MYKLTLIFRYLVKRRITHFAVLGNVTMCAVAGLAMVHTYSISYVKARADGVIDIMIDIGNDVRNPDHPSLQGHRHRLRIIGNDIPFPF